MFLLDRRSSRTKRGLDYDKTSDPMPPRQNVVPTAEKTDSSQQGLEFLFSPLLEEYYNPTHDQAEENNNDQAPNASFQEAEFINPFCNKGTRNREVLLNRKEYIKDGNGLNCMDQSMQEEGIDFEESICSVLVVEAVRNFRCPSSNKSFLIYQMDVEKRFLNGPVEGKEVYVAQLDWVS
ncbi:retrovirus-related pol polyprotein from transposon TNT 1-94 [Tanacetum coccineum]